MYDDKKQGLKTANFFEIASRNTGKTIEELKVEAADAAKENPAPPKLINNQPTHYLNPDLLGYAPRVLIDCNLPATQTDLKSFKRTNGHTSLALSAFKYGLPYGRDRLLFFWLITRAVQTGQNEIEFPGVTRVLADMKLTNTTKNIQWLKGAVLRAHYSTLHSIVGDPFAKGSSSASTFIKEIKDLDFKSRHRVKGSLVIGDVLTESSTVPIDMDMVRSLSRCWIAVDLYTFIRKRLYNHKSAENIWIAFSDLKTQFALLPNSENKHMRQQNKRGIEMLKKAKYECIPYFDKNSLVIPYVKLSH